MTETSDRDQGAVLDPRAVVDGAVEIATKFAHDPHSFPNLTPRQKTLLRSYLKLHGAIRNLPWAEAMKEDLQIVDTYLGTMLQELSGGPNPPPGVDRRRRWKR